VCYTDHSECSGCAVPHSQVGIDSSSRHAGKEFSSHLAKVAQFIHTIV
jgi:hypothetical protein